MNADDALEWTAIGSAALAALAVIWALGGPWGVCVTLGTVVVLGGCG